MHAVFVSACGIADFVAITLIEMNADVHFDF